MYLINIFFLKKAELEKSSTVAVTETPFTKMKFSFQMKSLAVILYNGDSDLVS